MNIRFCYISTTILKVHKIRIINITEDKSFYLLIILKNIVYYIIIIFHCLNFKYFLNYKYITMFNIQQQKMFISVTLSENVLSQ